MSAIFGIIYISLQLSQKFSNSPLSTVVESTIFPVAEIAYPAITICSKNRFHRERCKEAEARFLPNVDNETIEHFQLLLSSMNSFEFGALDEFHGEIFNFTSSALDKLNFTEVFEFVMLTCEEIFVGKCWWRNKYLECCEDDFFEVQRSEYGLCYSFNSAVSDNGKEKEVRVMPT
jgi:amiloride-sensitive sodium channel